MADHTPGPWRASTTNGMGGWIMAASHVVATVNDPANARLIAAAPTLYAFVRALADSGQVQAKETLASLGLVDQESRREEQWLNSRLKIS